MKSQALSDGTGDDDNSFSVDGPRFPDDLSVGDKGTQQKSCKISETRARGVHVQPWEGRVPIRGPNVASRAHERHSWGDTSSKSATTAQEYEGHGGGPPASWITSREKGATSRFPTERKVTFHGVTGSSGGEQPPQGGPRRGHLGGDGEQDTAAGWSPSLTHGGTKCYNGSLETSDKKNIEGGSGTWMSNAPQLPEARVQTRLFDSPTAHWVHATILANSSGGYRKEERGANNNRSFQSELECSGSVEASRCSPSGTRGAGRAGGSTVQLKPAAASALAEIFRRYDQEGRGFLLPDEVADLLRIWTCGHAKPPGAPSMRRRVRIVHPVDVTKPSRNQRGSARSLSRTRHPQRCKNKVLTLPAFLCFCEHAAVQDAVFMKHLLVTCGYDLHLTLQQPLVSSHMATSGVITGRNHRVSTIVAAREPQGMTYRVLPAQDGLREVNYTQGCNRHNVQTNGSSGKLVDRTDSHEISSPLRERLDGRPRTPCSTITDCIIDPAELWDRMEEKEESKGNQWQAEGVLSRGGGAWVSKEIDVLTTEGYDKNLSAAMKNDSGFQVVDGAADEGGCVTPGPF